ncbi:bifunctional aspartate kinase/homoserine dehydrogenase I [Buchnera aphidicola]|uniref:Bifunctional aspartokinase/homoserine dehydrogenase n=1 Tax=Buchnera aphidicola (Stegophylla sp.) TaxID=2315800 RepID=A0A4D6YB46_9GAMM|nr:bifunctional aspartate kinase/homoserine dehydrogenase I [Buchnera aphidicola (Stegophylla sp.)]QCI26322.1 bifunctional aspartate kinase/homoserine dehydrogenase I [Buchnera aphidicola (Stegophylla sp.)]
MKTLKFGGTSLLNSKKFLDVSNIIEKKIKFENISVILSAPSKVTNYLENIIKFSIINKKTTNLFTELKNIFYELIRGIKKYQTNFNDIKVITKIDNEINNIQNMTQGIQILRQCPDNIYAIIISKGEILSTYIMNYILISKNYKVTTINPIQNILASTNYLNATVNILESKQRIQQLNIPKDHIILMPGFIAGNKNKELVILGRNGSDYSASVLSVCLQSNICEIWTDVDGIYTCDPRIVNNAQLLKSISYQEAITLSYFGAKVLHPKTILPLHISNIPCIIKNTSYPHHNGTKIYNTQIHHTYQPIPITGITYLNNIIIIKIKILQLNNINDIIKKILFLFSQKKINNIFTIQSPTENKITFHLLHQEYKKIKSSIINAFQLEIKNKILKPIKIIQNLKIISIIGNNIQKNKTLKTRIFYAIEHTDINTICITDKLSKHAISIITDNNNIEKNIKIIHNILLYNQKYIELFLIGIGGVGRALLKQIIKQKKYLQQKKINLNIFGIANSKNMLINTKKIDLNNWETNFHKKSQNFCIKKIIKTATNYRLFNPVIVDCTSSQEIPDFYPNILSHNIHIVTPNKKANTGTWEQYQKIKNISIEKNKKFLYETNVSAGLPIIETLKNLFLSGDKLISFKGILSGSLSFIFGKLEEGMSISEATKLAQKLGFTEPNPKDDLSGIDVARKLLIIARESGYQLELKDIQITSILPKNFLDIQDTKIFLSKLPELDIFFHRKYQIAHDKNKVLRFVGQIKNTGICQVKLSKIDIKDPLYNVKNGENALTIYSKYYNPIPLVLRGYGAGNQVTASGIFSDLIRTLS